jgi:hypothetical protein
MKGEVVTHTIDTIFRLYFINNGEHDQHTLVEAIDGDLYASRKL